MKFKPSPTIAEVKSEKNDPTKHAFEILASDVQEVYSFNCAPLDVVLGGGVVPGRIYEFFGWESNGKTTFALECARTIQEYWKKHKPDWDYVILWLESESTIDKVRAHYMGLDLSKFLFFEAETLEDGHAELKAKLTKAHAKNIRIFGIWDTIAAAGSKGEKEGGASMAEKPKLARKMFRDITTDIGRTKSNLILLNQCSMGIGQFTTMYETPMPAIKFYASVRALLKAPKKDHVMKMLPNGEEEMIGITVDMKTVKNKLTKPFQNLRFKIMGETGLDKNQTIFDFLVDYKLIEVKGAGWKAFDYPAHRWVQGNELRTEESLEMESFSFQQKSKLDEFLDMKPYVRDWLNYIIYKYYCTTSPLLKVRIIDATWEFEKLFYGQRITKLTEKEIELAKLMQKEVDKADKLEEEKEAAAEKKAAKTTAKKEKK